MNMIFVFRETVVDCILEKFAGPAGEGLFSPSVQLTLYDTEKLVLGKINQVSWKMDIILSCYCFTWLE